MLRILLALLFLLKKAIWSFCCSHASGSCNLRE